jgi:hypothetical protein
VARSATVLDVSAVETRTPYDGPISTTAPLRARVVTTTAERSYNNPVNDGIMTFTASAGDDILYEKSSLTTGQGKFLDYATDANKQHYLTGFYPAMGWTSGATFSYTLDGKTDVMYTTPTGTTWTNTKNNGGPTLAFAHALTQLRLAFKKENESSIIVLNEVTLTGATTQLLRDIKCTMNPSTTTSRTTLSFEGVSLLPLPAYKKGTDAAQTGKSTPITTTETELAYVLIPYLTANSSQVEFTVKYTENGKEIEADRVTVELNNAESTQGKAYYITFRFADGTCKCKATATDWAEVVLYGGDSQTNPIDI